MEKKTIGKFMQALRRANGMTQKELGERLFVSDKTVSRWECDECTPELSLIPAIAEIFGVSTDELLRGERNRPREEGTELDEGAPIRQSNKGEKQFKVMLRNRMTRYKNLTLISYGISAAGLIAAMICNLGFLRGILGFWISMIFLVGSTICQLCFYTNAKLSMEEEDEVYTESIRETNFGISKRMLHLILANILLFAFLLPIGAFAYDAYTGLTLESWLRFGIAYVLIAGVVTYVAYTLFLRRFFVKRELLPASGKAYEWAEGNRKRMKRILSVCTPIAAALLVAIWVVNAIGYPDYGVTFDNLEDFQAFMEKEWAETAGKAYEIHGQVIVLPDIIFSDDVNEFGEPITVVEDPTLIPLYDRNGNVLCEYVDCGDAIRHIEYDTVDGVPITVYTERAWDEAYNRHANRLSALTVLIAVDFLVGALVYVCLLGRSKRQMTK